MSKRDLNPPQNARLRRMYWAWRYPNRLRPAAVPDRRPQSVVVTSLIFLCVLGLYAYGVAHADTSSMGSVVVYALLGALFVALLFGLWTGREVARWGLMRISIPFGGLFVVAGIVLHGIVQTTGSAGWLGSVLLTVAGVIMLAGGVGTLLDSVRSWCAGRNV